MNYANKRDFYYIGILLLVLYGLQGIGIIQTYLLPLLEFELFNGITVITVVAVATGLAAFMAYKYRKIG